MTELNTDTEMGSMTIILHAGNAKSDAYEALTAIKMGDLTSYEAKYRHALSEIKLANRAHAAMLRDLSTANRMKDVDLLMVHAEGHLTSTEVTVSMIGEFGLLYKERVND